jgi:hypothetical protein
MTLQRGLATVSVLNSPPPSVNSTAPPAPLTVTLRYTYFVYIRIYVLLVYEQSLVYVYSVSIVRSVYMYMLDLSLHTIIRSGAYVHIGFLISYICICTCSYA